MESNTKGLFQGRTVATLGPIIFQLLVLQYLLLSFRQILWFNNIRVVGIKPVPVVIAPVSTKKTARVSQT